MTDLAAKARRAAEWFTTQGWDVRHRGERWRLYSPDFEETDIYDRKDFAGENRLLIAYAEQEGWQDQEADGVEVLSEQQKVGSYLARWGMRKEGNWNWIVICPPLRAVYGSGTAPTRAEARAEAVEAARGMG